MLTNSKVPCASEGVRATHKACPKFKADVYRLAEVSEDEGNVLQEIAYVMSDMNARELRILGAAIINEATTRKNGFSFYQKVFVRYRGTARSNYLSNFMAARILSADANTVRVCSDDGKVIFTYDNTGDEGPSIYSAEAFARIRKAMIKNNNVVDPDHERNTTKALRAAELAELGEIKLNTNGVHGVVTPEKVSNSNKRAGKKGKRSEIVDLTSIAREIESGNSRVSHKDGTVVLNQNRYKSSKNKSGEVELSDM